MEISIKTYQGYTSDYITDFSPFCNNSFNNPSLQNLATKSNNNHLCWSSTWDNMGRAQGTQLVPASHGIIWGSSKTSTACLVVDTDWCSWSCWLEHIYVSSPYGWLASLQHGGWVSKVSNSREPGGNYIVFHNLALDVT